MCTTMPKWHTCIWWPVELQEAGHISDFFPVIHRRGRGVFGGQSWVPGGWPHFQLSPSSPQKGQRCIWWMIFGFRRPAMSATFSQYAWGTGPKGQRCIWWPVLGSRWPATFPTFSQGVDLQRGERCIVSTLIKINCFHFKDGEACLRVCKIPR